MMLKIRRGVTDVKKRDNPPRFDAEKMRASQQRFIDLYMQSGEEVRPMRMMLAMYKGHYGRLLLSVLFYIIKSCPTWILPLITADLIDLVITQPENVMTRIIIDLVVAVVLVILNVPFHTLYVRMYSRAIRHVEASLRGAMIRKLQQLSISFHKEMQSGKIQSKVMRDVEGVTGLGTQMFNTVLSVIINATITLVVVISSEWRVFLMFLVCVPAAVIIRRLFFKRMRENNHAFRKQIEQTSAAVFDMEELVPVTRAHALEEYETDKLTTEVTGIAERGEALDRLNGQFGATGWAAMLVFQTLCLFFTGWLALRGEITVGQVSLYQSYFGSLVGYVSSILHLLPTLSHGMESIRSIGEILSARDIEENVGKPKKDGIRGAYEFRDVHFSYDEKTPVLSGLNLTVRAGETVALVGESGAGKTTIINLVVGFNHPTAGEMLVDGEDLSALDLPSYRQYLAVVPQNTILFSGTIRENITYGMPDVTDEELWHAIRAARLESTIEQLPDGLETRVGEHGNKLSGGQRQRICIARAIIRDPRVIIFDEATSALDSVTEREIQQAIENLTADRTTFVVAHRLSTIKNADKIAVIRDGRCVEYGTYDELTALGGEFAAYRAAQS